MFAGLKKYGGIYYSGKKTAVSFPKHGNNECFQIEDGSFWFKHRNKLIMNVVDRFCEPGTVFFDIGGGNGYVSKALQDKNIKVVLLEPGEGGAINAKKRGVSNIICSAFEDVDLTGADIQAVGLFDVMEHIEYDMDFLNNINRAMESGGCIFITVPAFTFLWAQDDKTHFRRYTLKSLNSKLIACGFTPVYGTYFFSFLLAPVFLFRTIPYKLGLRDKQKSVSEYRKEHTAAKGIFGNIADQLFRMELKRISAGGRISFGTSCLMVAKKN
jgi:SAM-dependent methyltransferase